MGNRVHKVIGYALTDVEHKQGDVTDSRLNMSRIYAVRYPESASHEEELTVARFYRWIICNRRRLVKLGAQEGRRDRVRDHHMDEGLFLMRYLPRRQRFRGPKLFEYLSSKKLDFADAVIHAHEFGKPNVMVFQPFSCVEEWSRYDNIIDYTEESSRYHCKDRVHDLGNHCGIYPYLNGMVRVRGPKVEILPSMVALGGGGDRHCSEVTVDECNIPIRLGGGFYNQLVGRWDKKIPPIAKDAVLEHLLNDWRPSLPLELIWMLTYMDDRGCFNDVEAVKAALRPVLYVYWC